MPRIDIEATKIAATQHGIFHISQLDEAHTWLVEHRIRSGRWVHRGENVFSIAGTPDTWEQRLWVQLLNAGSGSVVGRCSAARIHRLQWFPDKYLDIVQPEVTVTRAKPRTSRRTSLLPHSHCTVVNGFPITTVARTIFDLAGLTSRQRLRRGWPYLPPAKVERILDDALVAKRTTINELASTFADLAGRGRPGTVLMRTLLKERMGDFVATESELEDRFVRLIADFDLPEPRRQVVLGDAAGPIGRVDFLFEKARLIVELDGHRFHAQRQTRHSDLQRDLRSSAAGWRTIRLDWWQLIEDGSTVVRHLKALLAMENVKSAN